MGAKKASNTLRAYRSGWKAFQLWCEETGRSSLPAEPKTIRSFATWCIEEQFRLETIAIRFSAIAHYHREAGLASPIDRSVREYLSCARRELKEAPGGKEPLTFELLKKIASRLSKTPVDIRDRAMILLNFAAGWRRSEIMALNLSDVTFVRQGLRLYQAFSKTDQGAKGRWVGIQPGRQRVTCPQRALREWLRIRGRWEGPLFVRFVAGRGGAQEITRVGLNRRGDVLHLRLKSVLEEIGEDPRRYAGHSLRSGMITEAAKHGASEAAIKRRTGHKSSQTLQRYIRPAGIFDMNPLRAVL